MRGRRRRARGALARAALVLGCTASPALAGAPNAGPPSRVELLARAERERAAGHDAEALAAALAAAKLGVTSPLLRFIAEEHAALGQLPEAYEAARSCTETAANEPPSENHDAVFLGCRALMHELEPRIALVTFGWQGELPAGVRLVLDGEAVEPERRTRGLAPGKHVLLVDADGYVPRALELALQAGDSRRVDLTLERAPLPRPATPVTATDARRRGRAPAGARARAEENARPASPHRASLTLPLLVTGGGAALLGAALATSLDSSAKYSDLRRLCARTPCGSSPPERGAIGGLDRATTALLLAGSVAAGAGAVWLTLTLRSRAEANAPAVGVGPGFCSVRGAF